MSTVSSGEAPESEPTPEKKVLEERNNIINSNDKDGDEDDDDVPPSPGIASGGSMSYLKPRDRIPAKRSKRNRDKPKRPLSAYNFFFKTEREKILALLDGKDKAETLDGIVEVKNDPENPDYLDEEAVARLKKDGNKVSFEEMGKIIGQRWKNIDPDRLQKFSELAAEDTERYKKEMQSYNGRQEQKMRSEAMKAPVPQYTDMHMKSSGGAQGYPDPSMAYGPPPGGYYGYPDSYPYPGMGMYPYGYPGEPMPPHPMGGPPLPPPDARPQYGHQGQHMYGPPPGYPMGYGVPGDGYGPPQGMDPYGGYGAPPGNWGPQ